MGEAEYLGEVLLNFFFDEKVYRNPQEDTYNNILH